MKDSNYQSKILDNIQKESEGSIFIHSDFYDIASPATVRQTLKRLVDQQIIARVMDGLYVKLEYSVLLKKTIYPAPVEVAIALARKFSWQIYPSKLTALNIVGLSTQISNAYEFLSDGPYKTYTYQNYEIIFKRTANKKIKLSSEPLIHLVIALDAIGKTRLTDYDKKIIRTYIQANKMNPNDLDQSKNIPEWIYQVIKEALFEVNHD